MSVQVTPALSQLGHGVGLKLGTFAMIGNSDSKAPEGTEKTDGKQASEVSEGRRGVSSSVPKAAARRTQVASSKSQDWLRRSLKKLYEDTAHDPVPDSFVKLLEELDRKEREQQERPQD